MEFLPPTCPAKFLLLVEDLSFNALKTRRCSIIETFRRLFSKTSHKPPPNAQLSSQPTALLYDDVLQNAPAFRL